MAAHKAYRIVVDLKQVVSSFAAFAALTELKLYSDDNATTQIVTSTGTAYASSTFDANWLPSFAFNGVSGGIGNSWSSAVSAVNGIDNLGVVLSADAEVRSFSIQATSDFPGDAPKQTTLQYTDDVITNQAEYDAATWVSVYTTAPKTGWIASEVETNRNILAQALNNDSFSILYETLTNIDVLANDSNVGTLLTIDSPPSDGIAVVNVDGVTIDYTPNNLFGGQDSFTYDVDSSGSPATVTLNILSPHKSWRLVVNDNNGGVKVTLADIELLNGLVNQSINSGVSYESSFDNVGNKGDKAFDGTATAWISASIDFSLVDTIITWHSVDRNLQTKPFTGWNEGSGNTPENNTVIHNINIYDENNVLIKTDTIPCTANVSQYSYTYTQAQEKTDSGLTRINTSLRIEIWVSRTDNFDLDGSGVAPHVIESWQRFDHRFNRV
jgi:hypothetical protein